MPVVAVLSLITGCLPIPHTTPRSDDVHGRVLDAHTRAPIQGAKIFLAVKPHHPTYTDANGHFDMKATRNFHWAYLAPEGEWPNNKDSTMEITHTNYLPLVGGWSGDVGNILLEPQQSGTH
jgi:hypothetical protein